jgi:NAD(P)-dependent dehydrogenase (short-subunit alcohol dehydrogenase family)
MNVNVNGVLYTAQAAGRQMTRLGIPGSIIMLASMSGSIANQVYPPSFAHENAVFNT